MRKPRKNYTPAEKVAILRRHLIDKGAVSDLCDEHRLQPTLVYAGPKRGQPQTGPGAVLGHSSLTAADNGS
jgi:transposase-like protein